MRRERLQSLLSLQALASKGAGPSTVSTWSLPKNWQFYVSRVGMEAPIHHTDKKNLGLINFLLFRMSRMKCFLTRTLSPFLSLSLSTLALRGLKIECNRWSSPRGSECIPEIISFPWLSFLETHLLLEINKLYRMIHKPMQTPTSEFSKS